MNIANIKNIEDKIRAFFKVDGAENNALNIEIIDDSASHRHHSAMRELNGSGAQIALSHLRIKIVSAKFEGMGKLERHQMVNKLLAEEFKVIHSISLSLIAPSALV